MFIQTEDTPNPATLKFLPGRTVMESGTAHFPTPESAEGTPLAEALYALEGVCGVFFGSDFVSVTKDEQSDWSVMKPLILGALVDYLLRHEKVAVASKETPSSKAKLPANDEEAGIAKEIIELIETRVRPAVAADGGDIIFDRFEEGIVYLRLQGACSGCPSSSETLKSGIENMLRYYIPEVQEVQAV